jgi:hypothetical protein
MDGRLVQAFLNGNGRRRSIIEVAQIQGKIFKPMKEAERTGCSWLRSG